ncbi:MAG: sulfotransferase family 2 domain-containing protein [Planctomycetes bacterium]|jgi:hypothetical protein|nr:sulfotransferase family 2 domain-containing protein [Planctomycetota bacterium]
MRPSPNCSFAELLSEAYLSKWGSSRPEQVFDRTTPLVICHLPKTAGTTFAAFAFKVFKSPLAIPWNAVDEGFAGFLSTYGQNCVVNGHIDHRHIEAAIQFPKPIATAVFIRNPVDRAISNYTYCCSEKHPDHVEFLAAFPTIDRYIAWGGMSSNYLAKTLVGGASTPAEAIEKAKARFNFIGISELYNTSVSLFSRAWGVPFAPAGIRMNSASQRNPQNISIPEDAISKLIEQNNIDLPFYHFVLDLYQRQQENLVTAAFHQGAARP